MPKSKMDHVQLSLFTKPELMECPLKGDPHIKDDMPLLSVEDRMNVEKSKYVCDDKRFRKKNPMAEAYGYKSGHKCGQCAYFTKVKKGYRCSKRGVHSGAHRRNWDACSKFSQ